MDKLNANILHIEKGTTIENTSEFIFEKLSSHLAKNENVLWFVTGGSSIDICTVVAQKLKEQEHSKLTVMLTDERYGAIEHPDSNWQQLLSKGFDLPQAKLIPVLTGEDRAKTVEAFNEKLKEEIAKADYKIGTFGIGADGHTAGILPHSSAVNSEELAFGYDSEKFERITITPKTILMLDEAIVYMVGESKWPVIDDLKDKNLPLAEQPAQVLKKIPLLTIFSDYNK
jgi:6-phosphogluconolactonase/glucosamine-6-phosphate isomerase/deaminase